MTVVVPEKPNIKNKTNSLYFRLPIKTVMSKIKSLCINSFLENIISFLYIIRILPN